GWGGRGGGEGGRRGRAGGGGGPGRAWGEGSSTRFAEDDLVTLRTDPAEAEVAGEEVAVGAAAFAEEALGAGRAFVDGGGGVGGEEEVVLSAAAHSLVSSATAFLALVSSTRALPSVAAAMEALLRARGGRRRLGRDPTASS